MTGRAISSVGIASLAHMLLALVSILHSACKPSGMSHQHLSASSQPRQVAHSHKLSPCTVSKAHSSGLPNYSRKRSVGPISRVCHSTRASPFRFYFGVPIYCPWFARLPRPLGAKGLKWNTIPEWLLKQTAGTGDLVTPFFTPDQQRLMFLQLLKSIGCMHSETVPLLLNLLASKRWAAQPYEAP